MKSNDEVMILIKIRELKEENMKLKDKVEGLQDRIDSAINYIENSSYCEVRKLLDILKGE